MLKVVGRHTKNYEDEGIIGFCYTLQALTLHKPNGGINHGFGREAMVFAAFDGKSLNFSFAATPTNTSRAR